jgi:hypothetical protein
LAAEAAEKKSLEATELRLELQNQTSVLEDQRDKLQEQLKDKNSLQENLLSTLECPICSVRACLPGFL